MKVLFIVNVASRKVMFLRIFMTCLVVGDKSCHAEPGIRAVMDIAETA